MSYRGVCFAAGFGLWGRRWRFSGRVTGAIAAPLYTALQASAAIRSRAGWSPVSSGQVATSLAAINVELMAKRLELRCELVPRPRRSRPS
jgi:hypothetical protein